MSEHTDQMDWASLDLERFKAVANMQIAAAQATADYQLKMTEVAERQIANAADKERLMFLRQQRASYTRAASTSLQNVNKHKNNLSAIEINLRSMKYIALGETASLQQWTWAWSGFYFFISKIGPLVDKNMLPATSAACDVSNFAHIRNGTRELLPRTGCGPIRYVLACRTCNVVVRGDSPAMAYLYNVAGSLVACANILAKEAADTLALAQDRLDTLEKTAWEAVLFHGDTSGTTS